MGIMSLYSTLFLVVCSAQLILGQRYVPAPGYERLYGNKEWPSKKVYEKTPRPTKWTPPKTPKPTKYVKTAKPTYNKTPRPTKAPKTPKPTYYKAPKTPQPTKADKSWPSKKSDMRAYADEEGKGDERLFSNHIKSCPSEVDFDMNAPCDYEGQCEFGEETCCGQTFPSLVCQCGGERSFCYYTDACFHPNC